MLPVARRGGRTRLVPGSSPRPLVFIAMADPPSSSAASALRPRCPGGCHQPSPDPATADRTTPARVFVPYQTQRQLPPGVAPQPPPLEFPLSVRFAVRPARSFGSVGVTGLAGANFV